jgi:heme/copper-type cytochrome/quinol oxidase subunit 2
VESGGGDTGAALKEAGVHALAVIAATVSTIALLVVLFLTVFVVSLAFRANRRPDSRKRTTDP